MKGDTIFAYDILANQSQLDTAKVGLLSVSFINGTLFGRAYDSILVTLQNLDMVLEIKYDESRVLIWHYGQPGRNSYLNHPISASKSPINGNIIISDAGDSEIVEIYYPHSSSKWRYAINFPEGRLRSPIGCTAVSGTIYVISDTLNGRLLIFNQINEEIIRTITHRKMIAPVHALVYDNFTKILVSDPIAGLIFIFDLETGDLLKSEGKGQIHVNIGIFFLLITLGNISLGIYHIVKKRKENSFFSKQILQTFLGSLESLTPSSK